MLSFNCFPSKGTDKKSLNLGISDFLVPEVGMLIYMHQAHISHLNRWQNYRKDVNFPSYITKGAKMFEINWFTILMFFFFTQFKSIQYGLQKQKPMCMLCDFPQILQWNFLSCYLFEIHNYICGQRISLLIFHLQYP